MIPYFIPLLVQSKDHPNVMKEEEQIHIVPLPTYSPSKHPLFVQGWR